MHTGHINAKIMEMPTNIWLQIAPVLVFVAALMDTILDVVKVNNDAKID